MNAVKAILKPIASLRLTVLLLALSMVLIFAGTLAQRTAGIETVKHRYFHTWFAYVEFQNLLPFVKAEVPYGFMMTGGWTLIVTMLVNLVAAHALRFKPSIKDLFLLPLLGGSLGLLFLWQDTHPVLLLVGSILLAAAFVAGLYKLHAKRAGVIVLHIGLILLLAGELVTSVFQVESQMSIEEGGYGNYSTDHRSSELAVVDPSASDADRHVVVPEQKLKHGGRVSDPALPFDVDVVAWYPNSRLTDASRAGPATPVADRGDGTRIAAIDQRVLAGTGDESSKVNAPSAYVTLTGRDGGKLGTYMVSTNWDQPQRVEVGGKAYDLYLRFRRDYKPFQIWLKDFQFKRFEGTEMARDYTSIVRLVDVPNGVDREVRIWMNHPLRYNGETYYQSSFTPNERSTVLQVVRNPGWVMPYYSCGVISLGLLAHFGWMLVNYIRKQAAAGTVTIVDPLAGTRPGKGKGKAKGGGRAGDGYSLAPESRGLAGVLFPAVVAAVVIGLFGYFAVPPSYLKQPPPAGRVESFDFDGFSRLPVNHQGRPMPMESLSRDMLKVMAESETFYTYDKEWKFGEERKATRIPTVQFLLDFMTESKERDSHEFLRITNPELLSFLKLDERQKRYSIRQLLPSKDELSRQMTQANEKRMRKQPLTPYEEAVLQLGDHWVTAARLGDYFGLLLVPPGNGHDQWRSVVEAGMAMKDGKEENEYVRQVVTAVTAYGKQDPAKFNAAVKAAQAELDRDRPAGTRTLGLEVFVRRFNPFESAKWVYGLIAFPLAALSWLGWRKPFRRAAFAAVAVAFVVHSLAILARIVITGRPPVTTLYTSAVAIGWFAILIAMAVELFDRRAIATAVAAVIGFVTLTIASQLYMTEADTMKQLQPVLDTNLWLWVHVQTVAIGYSATFLAGLLGIAYVIAGVFVPTFDAEGRKLLGKAMYGVVAFAMVFSFIGTTTGGIWADQSWGRFWGWDPKENGAVLIVCWNALILHARWAGLIRERGVAVLAIIGNIVTSWSWFGTNLLGVGLHSYGFMQGAAIGLGINALAHVALVCVGLIPLRYWRSLRADAAVPVAKVAPRTAPPPVPAR